MKKFSFVMLIIISLFIVGCVKQTPLQTQNQKNSQPILNQNTNTNLQVSGDLKNKYISLSHEYKLKYATYEEAVEAFKKALGMNVEPSAISFYVPGKVPREDGKPYFILDATTSFGKSSTKKNFCQKGWFSLIDDNIKFWEDYCGPIN